MVKWFYMLQTDISHALSDAVCRVVAAVVIKYIHLTHTHTTVLLLVWNMSGSTRVSRYQKDKTKKVKTNLDLLEQEMVSGSGIC